MLGHLQAQRLAMDQRRRQDRQNSLHKIRLDEQLHKQERKQKEKAAREQRHQEWREDFELTQRMLSIMRKNGSIPATNNRAGRFDDLPVDTTAWPFDRYFATAMTSRAHRHPAA